MVYYGTRGHGRGARDTPSPLRGQNLFCQEDALLEDTNKYKKCRNFVMTQYFFKQFSMLASSLNPP